jgi:hypothetical protein
MLQHWAVIGMYIFTHASDESWPHGHQSYQNYHSYERG